MFLSNIIESGHPTEITINDLYDFIDNITEQKLSSKHFISLMASSKKKYNASI